MKDQKYTNTLIKYKWQMGVYKIQDMIQLVKNETISKQEFSDITRRSYEGCKIKKLRGNQLEMHKNS